MKMTNNDIENLLPYILKVLSFYADKDNYNDNIKNDEYGFQAREAIKLINQINEEIIKNNKFDELKNNIMSDLIYQIENNFKPFK